MSCIYRRKRSSASAKGMIPWAMKSSSTELEFGFRRTLLRRFRIRVRSYRLLMGAVTRPDSSPDSRSTEVSLVISIGGGTTNVECPFSDIMFVGLMVILCVRPEGSWGEPWLTGLSKLGSLLCWRRRCTAERSCPSSAVALDFQLNYLATALKTRIQSTYAASSSSSRWFRLYGTHSVPLRRHFAHFASLSTGSHLILCRLHSAPIQHGQGVAIEWGALTYRL